ncbi:MAG TPA: hypothetical protein VN380_14470 [Thermoanaerobaculia bacterium]|nr:hypothetical protein [Thermoanaerobaculia bacterium]
MKDLSAQHQKFLDAVVEAANIHTEAASEFVLVKKQDLQGALAVQDHAAGGETCLLWGHDPITGQPICLQWG